MDRTSQVSDLEWELLIEKIRVNRLKNGEEVDNDLSPDEIKSIISYYQDRVRSLEAELFEANQPAAPIDTSDIITPTIVG